MTAPEHLTITGPEDILGFIPHSLGYWPVRSVVAMTLQGKRLGATLRVDLPDDGAAGTAGASRAARLARFARTVASYLEADKEADGSLLAFFTGTDADGAAPAALLAVLEKQLSQAGMPVRDAWLVGAKYWRNAYCNDPACCAPPGRPVEEIRNSRLNAEMVFRGSTVGAAPGEDRAPPAPQRRDPAVLASEQAWALLFAGRGRERQLFDQALEIWGRVLQAGADKEPAAELSGYLRATLCVPAWRDAVLVMAAAGAEAARRGAETFGVIGDGDGDGDGCAERPGTARTGQRLRETGERLRETGERRRKPDGPPALPLPPLDGYPAPAAPDTGGDAGAGSVHPVPNYGQVLLGLAPPAPDWPLMGRLERLLVRLGEAGGEAGAAALTGRGWIEWCRGKGSYADALFRQAGADFPGYRLAELLAELVRRGTLCGWAARKDSAWQRFGPEAA
jgi:hypothetical protein